MSILTTSIPHTETNLENKISTLLYLENLKTEKINSTESEPCPICTFNVDTGVCRKRNCIIYSDNRESTRVCTC